MARIQILSPSVVNQIAAGEVVERPASVLKELLENSLDAGARTIQVEIENGGLSLIRVIDDGSGMEPDDAVLALERHATSKLADAAGLFAICTMGFRGEALPAIASVARLRVDTSAETGVGTRLLVEGGRLAEKDEMARSRGTTVEVRDLFFNTPARRKFMRSASTEAGHSSEAVLRLALARRDVAFSQRSAGRMVFSTVAGSPAGDRAALALGREAHRHLIEVEGSKGEVRVTGLVTSPDHSEATTRAVYLFVNGRYVRDRGVAHAVLRAYAGTLPAGRHPAAVLFLEMPLSRVDVNVHPQKLEVRFADPREAYDAVYGVLSESLKTAPWLKHQPVRLSSGDEQPRISSAGEDVAALLDRARQVEERRAPEGTGKEQLDQKVLSFPIGEARSSAAPAFPGYFGSLRYIGQHARTYLLCEAPGGSLIVIDQHASHERLLFHRLRQAATARELLVQPFLIPQIVTLPVGQARAIEAGLPELARLGFELEPFGGESFAVKGAPAALGGVDLKYLFADLSQQLEQGHHAEAIDDIGSDLLATMACHAAVRANEEITREEVRALLDGLDAVDFKARCPHGRPVVFEVSLADLERRVGRR